MPDNYGSADDFRAYHTARGRDVSGYTDDDAITAALLLASEWLDARYRTSFGGTKVGLRSQLREWPRVNAFDIYNYNIGSSVVPTEIKNATYEAALRQLVAPGSLSLDWTPNQYRRVSVDGAISAEFMMFNDASDIQTRFKVIEEILSPILTGCGNSSPLSGSISRV
jgi:hypothetical protein